LVGNIPLLGPHSRPARLAKVDGRTKEARLMQAVRADLIAHLGGSPSAVQNRLIDRAALLSLHIELFDRRALESGGPLTERDSRSYLAYSNSLTRLLARLGIKGAKPAPPTIADVAAEIMASRESAAVG